MNRPKVPQIFKKPTNSMYDVITWDDAQQIFETWLESQKVVYFPKPTEGFFTCSETHEEIDKNAAYLVCETPIERECEKHEPGSTEFIDLVSCKHCGKKLVAKWEVADE